MITSLITVLNSNQCGRFVHHKKQQLSYQLLWEGDRFVYIIVSKAMICTCFELCSQSARLPSARTCLAGGIRCLLAPRFQRSLLLYRPVPLIIASHSPPQPSTHTHTHKHSPSGRIFSRPFTRNRPTDKEWPPKSYFISYSTMEE